MSILSEFTASTGEIVNSLTTSVKGLLVTLKYLVKPSEIITVQYGRPQYEGEPRHSLDIPKSFRGELFNDVERCTSCDACARVCPTGCIELESEMGADKSKILHFYHLDMTKCLFCGLCVEACPEKTKDESGEKCLMMKKTYDFSSAKKEDISFHFTATEEKLVAWREAATERKKKKDEEAAAKKAAAPAAAPAPIKEDPKK